MPKLALFAALAALLCACNSVPNAGGPTIAEQSAAANGGYIGGPAGGR